MMIAKCLACQTATGIDNIDKCAFDSAGEFQIDNLHCQTITALLKHCTISEQAIQGTYVAELLIPAREWYVGDRIVMIGFDDLSNIDTAWVYYRGYYRPLDYKTARETLRRYE